MLNRTSIEEANRHLQALYARVGELESIAQEQHDALLAKDSFIQTKVQELSRQDIIIQDLKNLLHEKDNLLSTKDKEIEELNHDLDIKNKELSILKQRNKALNDFMRLAPELKSVMTEIDAVVEYVNDIEDGSYADTNESPIDGGDVNTVNNIEDNILETSQKDNDERLSNGIDSNGVKNIRGDKPPSNNDSDKVNHSPTIAITEVSDKVNHSQTLVANGRYSSGEMMQHSGRLPKFSVSKDSDNEEMKVPKNSSGQKEVYF